MSLAGGAKLGPYEVVAPLGAGGMGGAGLGSLRAVICPRPADYSSFRSTKHFR